MKKLLSAILTAALLLSLLIPGIPASAEGAGRLAVSSANAAPGGTVTMDISLAENPGLSTLQLQVEYDPAMLELISVNATTELGQIAVDANYSSPYQLAWIDVGTENNTYTGNAATLTFRVKATASLGQTSVLVKCTSSYAVDLSRNEFLPATGTVTISGPLVGDLDANGTVSSDDAIYLLYRTLFGEDRYSLNQPCDFDRNGRITSDDAIYLLYRTLFGETRYPLNPLVS